MNIIRVKDIEGNSEYDLYIQCPDNILPDAAMPIIDKAIVDVKEADKETFGYDDLMAVLTPLGFKSASVFTTNERW